MKTFWRHDVDYINKMKWLTFHRRDPIWSREWNSNLIFFGFHSDKGTHQSAALNKITRLKPQTMTGSIGWKQVMDTFRPSQRRSISTNCRCTSLKDPTQNINTFCIYFKIFFQIWLHTNLFNSKTIFAGFTVEDIF